jgi:CHASE2 domain-containing sensor protein
MTKSATLALLRDLRKALLLIAVAVVLELGLEHTRFARELAHASHRFLHGTLTTSGVPIVLVDITELASKPLTPRHALQDLLIAIARHKPKAIGVDIDFAPDEQGHIDPDDPQFLDLCLRLRNESGVPIFLGVARTAAAPAEAWLGTEKYQSLAASILIPKDTRKLPFALRAASDQELRSLSAALAHAHGSAFRPGPIAATLERWGLIESLSRRSVQDIAIDEFLVDYSAIESFQTIRTISADFAGDPANERIFKGNLVIVGDVDGARDTFTVAGRDKTYPGITVHASAATTLINRPLYEVTHSGRIVLTIVLLVAVFFPVIALRTWARARDKQWSSTESLQGVLILGYTVLAVIGAGLFVRFTHIIWDGFFLAFFALALHGPIEEFLHMVAGLMKRRKVAALLIPLLLPVAASGNPTGRKAVGYVERLSGPVFMKPAGTARTVGLAAPRDLVRPLHAGDRLRCGSGGSARVLVGNRVHELAPSAVWFVVPQWTTTVVPEVRAAFEALFLTGGRPKGGVAIPGELRILAPAHHSRVIASELLIRWTRSREECPITAWIADSHGTVLWQTSGMETGAGMLDSAPMRKALEGQEGPFELRLADACDHDVTVSFDTLASEDAALMRSDLEAWQETSPGALLLHLGRAAIYARYGVLTHVADEYEAALAIVPDSAALLSRTIDAHDVIGNVARSRQLAAKLKSD